MSTSATGALTAPTSPACISKVPLCSLLYLLTTSPILNCLSSLITKPPKSSFTSGLNLVKLVSKSLCLTSFKKLSIGLPNTLSPVTPNLFNYFLITPSNLLPITRSVYTSPIT